MSDSSIVIPANDFLTTQDGPWNLASANETAHSRSPVRQAGEALVPRTEFVFRTNEGDFVYQQPVSIAKPALEHGYVIPKSEWDSLKLRIQQLPETRNWYELAASFTFATFVAGIFALPVFYDISDRLPRGVLSATVGLCCISALVTPLLLHFNRKLKTVVVGGSVSKLVSDMTAIENRFANPPGSR